MRIGDRSERHAPLRRQPCCDTTGDAGTSVGAGEPNRCGQGHQACETGSAASKVNQRDLRSDPVSDPEHLLRSGNGADALQGGRDVIDSHCIHVAVFDVCGRPCLWSAAMVEPPDIKPGPVQASSE